MVDDHDIQARIDEALVQDDPAAALAGLARQSAGDAETLERIAQARRLMDQLGRLKAQLDAAEAPKVPALDIYDRPAMPGRRWAWSAIAAAAAATVVWAILANPPVQQSGQPVIELTVTSASSASATQPIRLADALADYEIMLPSGSEFAWPEASLPTVSTTGSEGAGMFSGASSVTIDASGFTWPSINERSNGNAT